MAARSGQRASPSAVWVAVLSLSAPACTATSDLCGLSAEWCGEAGPSTSSSATSSASSSSTGAGEGGAGGGGGQSGGAAGSGDPYRTLVLGDDPLGYWRLGDADPPVAHDETGSFDGTYVGGVLLGEPGIDGRDGAAHFLGRGDLMSVGDRFDFSALAAFTLEAWVKPDALPTELTPICSKGGYLGDYFRGYTLDFYDQGVRLMRCHDDTCQSVTGPPIQAGVYSHVVAAFDGATFYVYVDGQAPVTAASPVELADTDAAFVWAGSLSTFGLFVGLLDEVAVYGYALGPEKVAAHHAAGLSRR